MVQEIKSLLTPSAEPSTAKTVIGAADATRAQSVQLACAQLHPERRSRAAL